MKLTIEADEELRASFTLTAREVNHFRNLFRSFEHLEDTEAICCVLLAIAKKTPTALTADIGLRGESSDYPTGIPRSSCRIEDDAACGLS